MKYNLNFIFQPIFSTIGQYYINQVMLDRKTLYTNPYLIVTEAEYTKHYYAESQRIASKLGGGWANALVDPLNDHLTDTVGYDYVALNEWLVEGFNYNSECVGMESGNVYYIDGFTAIDDQYGVSDPEINQYFYHPDHLGSSSFITNASGNVDQHLQYLPFGEPWIDQRTQNNIRFTFSGKERDEETGYNYFGARYYNADISIWLSVDPLSDQAPGWTPYRYGFNNPLKFTDPTGMLESESTHTDEDGNVIAVYHDGDLGVYKHSNGTTKEDLDKKHGSLVLNNPKGAGGEKMGETEYIDEFIDPRGGRVMTEYQIQFGRTFDPIIESISQNASNSSLPNVMLGSLPGGEYDIKTEYKNVGALLNGKYATSRSAGNYLAGKNAAVSTFMGGKASFGAFQNMAGALHQAGKMGLLETIMTGKSWGPPPTYGEEFYQFRMSQAGWLSSGRKL